MHANATYFIPERQWPRSSLRAQPVVHLLPVCVLAGVSLCLGSPYFLHLAWRVIFFPLTPGWSLHRPPLSYFLLLSRAYLHKHTRRTPPSVGSHLTIAIDNESKNWFNHYAFQVS